MRWHIVRALYLKELRETLRDRRTITFMLVLPLVLYPMLIIGLSRFQRTLEKESQDRTARVFVWGEAPQSLLDDLKKQNFEVTRNAALPPEMEQKLQQAEYQPFAALPNGDSAEAEKKSEEMREADSSHPLVQAARTPILDRKTDIVLVLYPTTPGKEGRQDIAVLFDSVRQDSRRARGRLGTVLEEYRGRVQSEREVKHALDTGFTKVLRQESRDVAPKVRRSGFSISISLPFMLLAITATAGFYRAVETTAGEKERNTMQTLLCAPVRSIEIVAGKFASIATITLIAAAANIASLGFTFGTVSRQLSGGSTLSLGQYLIVFAVLVPVTLLTSALFLAVGVFAKDFRDGQNLATPVMFLTMLPASVTMLPGVEANAYTVMIPCVNVALLIKALLVGEAKPDFIFLTLVSSAAYATLALLFAARVFERENLLTGGKDSFRGIFGFSDQRREITPSMAFATFCVVMVVLFYGTSLIKIDMRYVVVASQYIGMLLPPVAILLFLKLPLKQTLALRWPGWQPMVAAVLIGLAAWSAASLLLRLLEPPESLSKALQKVMLVDRVDIPMLWIFFIASISPGLCEEVLFRGYIQGSFRKLGMVASIGLSAFLFAVAHASVYRMLPVLFLGLLLGWLYWQSKSTLPGMVAHALNNGVAISIMTVPAIRDYFVQHKLKYLPVSWSLAGLIVVAAGVWLATQGRVSESSKKEEA